MERTPRLAWTTAVAAAVHVAMVVGVWRTRPHVASRAPAVVEETLVDVVTDPVPPPRLPAPSDVRSEAPVRASEASSVARHATSRPARSRGPAEAPAEGHGDVDVGDGAAWAPAENAGDVAAPPAAKADTLPPPLLPRAERAPSAVLEAPLAERTANLGLGAGGQVLGIARTVAGAAAPQRGHGTVSIETDANGSVTRVGSTSPGWEAFARDLRAKLAGKRLRVPPGARGVIVRLAVNADVTGAPPALTGESKAVPCRPQERERDQAGRVDVVLNVGCQSWQSYVPLPRHRVSVSIAGEQAI